MKPLATIALAILLPASIGAGAGAQELKTPLPAVRPPVDVSALGPMRDALGRPLESVCPRDRRSVEEGCVGSQPESLV
jgi:hypothetical protein